MAYNLGRQEFRQQLLDEISADEDIFGGESSDHEVDNVSEHSDYEESDECEDEIDEELENAPLQQRLEESRARGRPQCILRGKNSYTWSTRASKRRSERFSNVQSPPQFGPSGAASNFDSFEKFWDILFPIEIFEIIVEHTNNKIEDICAEMIERNVKLETYHHHTDVTEMKAFVSILYYSGLWKSSNVNNIQLWSKENGLSFYRCVMPRSRFLFLGNCLRFDDKKTRDPNDKFAPIRKIWDIFIANCQRYYTPSHLCTVDEQLLGFRGRCSFRVYMKSKPDRYGLKLISLNDAKTSYMIHAIPYLGKQNVVAEKGMIPEYFLREVSAPIHNTNRTVTCDNWFMGIPTIERLLKPPYSLPITGTIKKNKREIPAEMKIASKNPPETKFCFSRDVTLLSYSPKKHKVVLVASTYMKSTTIIEGKPEIVLHYNETKGGTDTFDKLCHAFTVSRRTNRWPVRVLFGMLDQAAVNARILLKCKFVRDGNRTSVTPQYCLKSLYMHLATDHLKERHCMMTLRQDLKLGIAGILGIDRTENSANQVFLAARQRRCDLCPRAADKKTRHLCGSCERYMCDNHRSHFCTDCAATD